MVSKNVLSRLVYSVYYWSGIHVRLVGLVYADVVAAHDVEKRHVQNTRACTRLQNCDVLI